MGSRIIGTLNRNPPISGASNQTWSKTRGEIPRTFYLLTRVSLIVTDYLQGGAVTYMRSTKALKDTP